MKFCQIFVGGRLLGEFKDMGSESSDKYEHRYDREDGTSIYLDRNNDIIREKSKIGFLNSEARCVLIYYTK